MRRKAMEESLRLKMLEPPAGRVDLVLDTDTKNEIDDQFAVVYALLSPESIKVEAFHAAPFVNEMRGYPDPALGMEGSYQEIVTILEKLGVQDMFPVIKGSRTPLEDPAKPVESEAAENLVRLALQQREKPLYVAAIGAVTNVASAILMEPKIIEHIVVIWLGGHPTYWDWRYGQQIASSNHHGPSKEFNTTNDPLGAMALFDSGVPFVWVPCKNVAEHLRTCQSEIDLYIGGRGYIGDYLDGLVREYFERAEETFPGESLTKVLWDISTIAWLINHEWVPTRVEKTPKINRQKITDYEAVNPFDPTGADRHSCRIAQEVKRDSVYADLFKKIDRYSKGEITIKTS